MNSQRKFLVDAINSGLEFGQISSSDLIEEVTMEVLAHHLPVAQKSKLISASLEADSMDAALILKTLSVATLCEHCPVGLLWNAIAKAAQRGLDGKVVEASTAKKPSPTLAKNGASLEPSKPESSGLKPNRAARPSVNAGATSRKMGKSIPMATASSNDAFDVDIETGVSAPVGGSADFDIIDESEIVNEETNPGLRKN